MRQVPQYLLIGNGRVAKHMQHYFSVLNIPYQTWHRQQSEATLQKLVPQATHLLILISDNAIENFIQRYLMNTNALRIHFSGSLYTPLAFGAHPLMSFNTQLYSLIQYQQICFVIDADAPPFTTLLPGLSNDNCYLNPQLKAKYHALCVLSGNFSCLLWQKLFSDLQNEFQIPERFAYPYLQQQTSNLLQDAATALTGPLVRNDQITITNNLTALANDPFQAIYQSFVTCYQELKEKQS